jgi:phenylpropionate dioxygenase-like ring-hydroxylating dioxygenase large terminal subunit
VTDPAYRGHPVFANPRAAARSWYAALRSRSLRPGRTKILALASRRVLLYRGADGAARAIDARCPHLGADLGLGKVEANAVRCAFHGWCFGFDGVCRDAPGHPQPPARRARVYPCEERYGLLWIFNGPEPLFQLPAPEGRGWWSLALPSQRIRCHPHLVLANGLDVAHYETLHGMGLTEPATLSVGRHEVSVAMRGRPKAAFWRFVSGTRQSDIVARFTTIGGSLAWTTVEAPVRFHVLFSGRPDANGACVTRTVFLFPRTLSSDPLRAIGLMAMLLHDDRKVLDSIEFRPDFAATDGPMQAFAGMVNGLGAW